MARLNYEIPDSLHHEAKAAAALQGHTLRQFVVTALDEAVARSGIRKGAKPATQPDRKRRGT